MIFTASPPSGGGLATEVLLPSAKFATHAARRFETERGRNDMRRKTQAVSGVRGSALWGSGGAKDNASWNSASWNGASGTSDSLLSASWNTKVLVTNNAATQTGGEG